MASLPTRCCTAVPGPDRGRRFSCTAPAAGSAPSWRQLARHNGIRVIGTAAPRHHESLRALGIEPIDYHDPDLGERVRELAPAGVDAVFDHLGPDSFRTSFCLLAPGGTLVAYGSAARLDDNNSMIAMFVGMLARLYTWNLLPNKRRANFYNFWAGHSLSIRQIPAASARRPDGGAGTAGPGGASLRRSPATFPLTEAAAAFTLAESHTTSGKIVLLP